MTDHNHFCHYWHSIKHVVAMITNMGQDIGRIWVAAYEKGMTSVPPISPVFWSNMVSPNDSDNESQAA